MRYMMLIYTDPAVLASMSEAEMNDFNQNYMAFNQEAGERGVLRDGIQLHPATTATTLRIRDGKTKTVDGPFAETKEHLGGVYVLDCENLDEALEFAAKIPSARNGSIEVRPIMERPQ